MVRAGGALSALFETERLRARRFVPADAPAAHAFYGDPEVMRFFSTGADPDLATTRERMALRIAEYAAHPGYGFFALERRAEGDLVGHVALLPVEWKGPDVEIGWLLARGVWGAGYATEAARAMLEYGFARLGLERIVALIRPANRASHAVAQRLGMRATGPRTAWGGEMLGYEIARAR